jgi:heme/copper-type cytochrome/quinol oxidase subunit 2
MNIINAFIVFLIGLVIGLIFARSYIVGRMRRRRDRYKVYLRQRRRGAAVGQSFFILIISFVLLSAFSKYKARSDTAKSTGKENWEEVQRKDHPETNVTSTY